MTIIDYQNEKSKYLRLKSNIQCIINHLRGFNTNISSLKNKLINTYTINDENAPVYNRVVKLGSNSVKVKDYLSKTIIPAIDLAIKKCDVEITKLKAAESAAVSNKTVTNKSNSVGD